MAPKLEAQFRIEAALAAIGGLLFVLTLVWRDWIEATTGYNPDRHSGSAEWAIVAALLAITITCALLARTHWKRLAAAPQNA